MYADRRVEPVHGLHKGRHGAGQESMRDRWRGADDADQRSEFAASTSAMWPAAWTSTAAGCSRFAYCVLVKGDSK